MSEKVKVIDIAQRSIKQTGPYSYMHLACKSDSFRQCLFSEYSGHLRVSVPDLQGHLSGVSRPIPAPKSCVPEL